MGKVGITAVLESQLEQLKHEKQAQDEYRKRSEEEQRKRFEREYQQYSEGNGGSSYSTSARGFPLVLS